MILQFPPKVHAIKSSWRARRVHGVLNWPCTQRQPFLFVYPDGYATVPASEQAEPELSLGTEAQVLTSHMLPDILKQKLHANG